VIVKLLLEIEIDVEAKAQDESTALHLTILKRKKVVMQQLLERETSVEAKT